MEPTAEAINELTERLKEERQKLEESDEAIKSGKGILKLETPIMSGDEKIEELAFDFTTLTGMEYTYAMDSDPNAKNSYNITNRQALNLFAAAAAKKCERLDIGDIVTRLGMTDTSIAVQMAILFFRASLRAARLRITKE